MMITLNDVKEYLDKELVTVKDIAKRKPWFFNAKDCYFQTETRAYGIIMFVQKWLDYNELDNMYENFRAELKEILGF